MPPSRRDALVVALAVTTGGMDAIGFIAMGGVFASVMTGNLVLLGVSIGRRNGSLAAHVGVALAGYIAGVIAGVIVAGRPDPGRSTWPARVTAALLVELALIIGLTAVRSLAAPGLSSTYMTGTLTGLVSAVAAGDGLAGQRRNLAMIAAVVIGAALGGVLVLEVPRAAPAVALAALSSVVLTARLTATPTGRRGPGV